MNRGNTKQSVWRLSLILGLLTAFVFYANLALFNFDGVVICVGEDGHLAIETIEANQHRVLEQFTFSLEWMGQVWVDDTCQDVPIPRMVSATYLPGKNKVDVGLLSTSPTFENNSYHYPNFRQQILSDYPLVCDTIQTIIQSTVLLI